MSDPSAGTGTGSTSTDATTRTDLHAVAEQLLAGPQHRASGTIRLRVLPGGFGTVAEPALRLDGTDLVLTAPDGAERRIALEGARVGDVAERAGLQAGAPVGVYPANEHGEPDRALRIDREATAALADWFRRGDEALRRLAPQSVPVLWPEHFDLGIALDEVNYGVSPGDGYSDQPYAYVGPWTAREGTFWNAPFGATRPAAELPSVQALLDFFEQGRRESGTS